MKFAQMKIGVSNMGILLEIPKGSQGGGKETLALYGGAMARERERGIKV